MNEPLTKQDIKALKNASYIAVDHYERRGEKIRQLRATLRAEKSSTGFDQAHLIPISSYVTAYRGYQSEDVSEPTNAHESFESYSDEMRTFLAFLRVGDVITARWSATEPTMRDDSKSMSYIDGARCTIPNFCYNEPLNYDKLFLEVHRGDKKYSFLMATSVCPDNSARMIKTDGRTW